MPDYLGQGDSLPITATAGDTFLLNSDKRIYIWESGAWSPFGGAIPNQNEARGKEPNVSADGSSSVTIHYGVHFLSAPVVQVTPEDATNPDAVLSWNIESVTLDSFDVSVRGGDTGDTCTVDWRAQ